MKNFYSTVIRLEIKIFNYGISEMEEKMSKYKALWNYIQENEGQRLKLTYAEIEKIAGVPIDHSFLNCKKELLQYGYKVGKISMKDQTVTFEKLE